ncbi:hypothetical protein DLAC_00705 [Tieghemostelium lacteum]|uniref:PH domain-containing protein n=1 Tax=Tieghemostelium lacteum TaxID=361077 RepID=A0A152A6U4_TIELA|nr:hypothetical protein DLAC_00705 [Tieghemostelium lacteum]|eukprot:KYR01916.1 hypothetical protein DLAC_00705 [Tieghemostelium lacteum]
MEIQGKLFVTVIQAQNLVVKSEKSNAAEIVGALFDPFSQSLERIQSFSSTHIKKLAPVFTVPGAIVGGVVGGVGGVIGGIAGGITSGVGGILDTITQKSKDGKEEEDEEKEKKEPGIVCTITMDDQEFKSNRSIEITEPKWNQSHSFNISNPMAELKFSVSLASDEKEYVIGTSLMNLIEEPHLWEQKPVAKWINLTKKIIKDQNNNQQNDSSNQNGNSQQKDNDEDEIVGRVELQLQYKYRKVWDSIYCGKMLLMENKFEEAIDQFNEAIQKYPTIAKLYSLVVDCYIGLRMYTKAFENSILFLQYDTEYHGYLKAANVLMESGQLDKAQNFIDKARQKDQSESSEDIKYAQMQLDHLMLVNNVNRLLEQGYEDFKNQDYSSAIQSFTLAIENNNHSTIFYELRALCYVAAKNYTQAINDTNRILEIDHNWPKKEQSVSGYLWKDGQINVMAKKRWFTMKSLFLFYYVDQNELNPQGIIVLNEFGIAPKPNQKVKFQLATKDRAYYLKVDANQPEEFDKWVGALTKLSKTKVRLPPIKESQDRIIWKTNFSLRKKEKTSFMLPDVMLLPEQLFVESGKLAFSIGDKIKSKLTSIPLSECSMTGWVYKMGQVNKDWQRRYFMISGTNLYYAKIKDFDEKTTISITPTGTLPLEKARIDPAPTTTNKANSFEVITLLRRRMLLATDTPELRDAWMKAIVIASGVQIAEKETETPTPTSEELFKSRGRKIKSLRAVPNLEQQLKEQQQKEQQQKEQQEIANRKITKGDVSAIESKYFTKFNLPVSPVGSQAIITSKSNLNNSTNSSPTLSSSPSTNPTLNNNTTTTTSTNNNNNNNNKNNNSPSPTVTRKESRSPQNRNSANISINDDDNSKESTGLLSGKNKSTDQVEDGSGKRCCKCTIQ